MPDGHLNTPAEPGSPAAASSSSSSSGFAPYKRVAVVVAHGVADQKPGDTSQAFVELMVAAGGRDGARYTALGSECFTLPVPLPMPLAQPRPKPGAGRGSTDVVPAAIGDGGATLDAFERGTGKSFRQSWVSDFHRYGFDRGEGVDAGLAFTNYLLTKAQRYEMPPQTYSSTQQTLLRHDRAGGSTRIDVHELYWADLSRLSGSAPRIVTEVFTLIFRLSRLARDTVERASTDSGPAWALLRHAQTTLDWLFTNVLAQLFALLLGVGLYLVAVGLLTGSWGAAGAVTTALAAALFGGAVLALLYFRRPTGRDERAPPSAMALALAVAILALLLFLRQAWTVGPAVLTLLIVVYLAGLKAGDTRFPFVWHSGVALLTTLLAFTAGRLLLHHFRPAEDPAARDLWLDGGMTALEAVLLAIKGTWVVLAVVLFAWAMLSLVLSGVAWAKGDLVRRASAATGRLGMLLSLTTFLLVSMALWAALSSAVRQPLAGHDYEPFYWKVEAPQRESEPLSLLPAGSPTVVAQSAKATSSGALAGAEGAACRPGTTEAVRRSDAFVDCRYVGTTQTFPLIVALLFALGLYLVATVLPSLLAELRLTHSSTRAEARRLGLWLTVCYRWLDRTVALFTLLSASAAVAVVGWWLAAEPAQASEGWIAGVEEWLAETSPRWLGPLTITATSALAAFSVLGGLLSRVLPGLRAPLDVALDVDNYMREFPRNAIPRVRMLARAQALFDHLSRGGYDSVVVVAHSQGTVLASDTLRWLSSQSLACQQTGRVDRLKARLHCGSVRLLTLGSPLRQLYGARFPKLYAWVLADHGGRNGPRAEDVGVERWANAFGSGDYVGRWLWARSVQAPRKYHPLIDDLEPGLGRALAYDAFDPMPPQPADLSGQGEFETCVGYDAHTHYFDPPGKAGEPQVVALLADDLIALP